jgi:hypothetical protein
VNTPPHTGTPATAAASPHLTDPQERAVSSTLRRLEELLSLMEYFLAGDQPGILLTIRATFDTHEQEGLRSLMSEARRTIRAVAETFALPHQERSARRVLDGHLVQMWSSLEDTRPKRLGGYGPMDPTAAASLDPLIGRLIDLVNAMRDEVLR